jgi:hypothetical protein
VKHQTPRPPLLEMILRRVPFVGYAMRLFETQNFKELALFGANVLGTAVLLVGAFGFPALILILYVAVALAASFILLATFE